MLPVHGFTYDHMMMLWDSYVAALRRAAADGLTLDAVKLRIKDEVEIILTGARKN